MSSYDPSVIREYAEHLYQRAALITRAFASMGFLVGLTFNSFIDFGTIVDLLVLILITGFGYFIGSNRGAELKLQAQIALCQVQIEENTRVARQGSNRPVQSMASSTPVSSPTKTKKYKLCPNCNNQSETMTACEHCGHNLAGVMPR